MSEDVASHSAYPGLDVHLQFACAIEDRLHTRCLSGIGIDLPLDEGFEFLKAGGISLGKESRNCDWSRL